MDIEYDGTDRHGAMERSMKCLTDLRRIQVVKFARQDFFSIGIKGLGYSVGVCNSEKEDDSKGSGELDRNQSKRNKKRMEFKEKRIVHLETGQVSGFNK